MNLNEFDLASVIVARANFCQFRSGQRTGHPRVESRMLLWCVTGCGFVSVNEVRHAFGPGEYFFLPWGHEILYEADADDPFLVGGIHIIPYQKSGQGCLAPVSHRPGDPTAGLRSRRDIAWPGLNRVTRGLLDEDRLGKLASYVVEVFCRGNCDEGTLRDLGRMTVREIFFSATTQPASSAPAPRALRRILDQAPSHIRGDLAVRDLAEFGRCSIPSVHRLFRAFLDTTPHRYIANLRMREAKRLLRTTSLSVGAVGPKVGFSDPFHFSRFFKRHAGFSPKAYRQSVAIM